MPIKINGATSGSTTITAPATGGDESIELSTALAAKAPLASPTFTGTVALPSGTTLDGSVLTSGKILQVVSATKTDTGSTSSASFGDITGMSVSITPSETSSSVLILVNAYVSNSNAASSVRLNLVRDSTDIAQPSGGTTPSSAFITPTNALGFENASIVFVDSPNTTSATTYKLQYAAISNTAYINRSGGDANRTTVSTITAMEIGA